MTCNSDCPRTVTTRGRTKGVQHSVAQCIENLFVTNSFTAPQSFYDDLNAIIADIADQDDGNNLDAANEQDVRDENFASNLMCVLLQTQLANRCAIQCIAAAALGCVPILPANFTILAKPQVLHTDRVSSYEIEVQSKFVGINLSNLLSSNSYIPVQAAYDNSTTRTLLNMSSSGPSGMRITQQLLNKNWDLITRDGIFTGTLVDWNSLPANATVDDLLTNNLAQDLRLLPPTRATLEYDRNSPFVNPPSTYGIQESFDLNVISGNDNFIQKGFNYASAAIDVVTQAIKGGTFDSIGTVDLSWADTVQNYIPDAGTQIFMFNGDGIAVPLDNSAICNLDGNNNGPYNLAEATEGLYRQHAAAQVNSGSNVTLAGVVESAVLYGYQTATVRFVDGSLQGTAVDFQNPPVPSTPTQIANSFGIDSGWFSILTTGFGGDVNGRLRYRSRLQARVLDFEDSFLTSNWNPAFLDGGYLQYSVTGLEFSNKNMSIAGAFGPTSTNLITIGERPYAFFDGTSWNVRAVAVTTPVN